MECLQTRKFPQLCYRKAGKGPAVMLVHGFPENCNLWHKIIPVLANSFTVLVPDLPGSGKSSFTGNLSIEDMAEGLNLILEQEQIEKVVLAGHSMGGYTALAFAELYGAKLKGLSLVHSQAAADTDEKKETRRKAIALIRKGGKDVFVRQMIPNLFSKAFKAAYPEVIAQQIDRGMQLSADSMVAFYNAMINRPDRISTLYSNINIPVQWIIGKEDTVAPPEKVAEQSNATNVSFVSVYKDSSHMSMIEQDKVLAEDLRSFMLYCFRN